MHVMVLNQHGENRGDEAAMRAMIRGITRELGQDVEFDVVVQFRDRNLSIFFKEVVRLHPIFPSVVQAIGLVFYACAKAVKINLRFLLGAETGRIISAFESADMIISAPGGPYFGDIYAKHEPLHWFYVWLGALYKKPMFLYSPSCGPFQNRIFNWFRRRIYKMFDILCAREYLSANYLRSFLGEKYPVYLTADSTLQENIQPFNRSNYFVGTNAEMRDKFLVTVTGIQYTYPRDRDPQRKQAHFNKVLLTLMLHLSELQDCHFIFLPQLYGKVHDDTLYHRWLGEQLPIGVSWEIVPPQFNSDHHRKIFGMADICLASRYHPQIFSTSAGVPGVFPYYEHKQFAYLSAIGMNEFAFNIRELNIDLMSKKIDIILNKRDEISAMLHEKTVLMRKRAYRSSRLAALLYKKQK